MIANCPECRKKFEVLYPDMWAYKRNGKYWCTWKCYRKKENDDMNKLTLEQKKQAVEIAIGGGSPTKYLEECGAKNPSGAWFQIRKKLEQADPAKAEEIEKAMHNKVNREYKARKKEAEAAPVVKLSGPIRIEAEEPEQVEVVPGQEDGFTPAEVEMLEQGKIPPVPERKITAPMMHSGKTAIGWEGDFGTYIYDRKHGYIDYESNDGDELSMPVEAWRNFLAEIREVGRLMGVEL